MVFTVAPRPGIIAIILASVIATLALGRRRWRWWRWRWRRRRRRRRYWRCRRWGYWRCRWRWGRYWRCWWRWWRRWTYRSCGSDLAIFEVGESHKRIRIESANICGVSGISRAWTPRDTRCVFIPIWRLERIEPKHVIIGIVPDGEHKDHATSLCFTHLLHATKLSECVLVLKKLLGCFASWVCERVHAFDGWPTCIRVVNLFAILHVVAAHLD